MHKTYHEVKQQYEALEKTYNYILQKRGEIKRFYKENHKDSLTFIGCGSSYSLCRSAEVSAKKRMGVKANSFAAGDVMLNYSDYEKILTDTVLAAPSRSGSTTEVINAVELVKENYGSKVVAVTCVVGSELSKIADLTLELPWAFDESVCQTRTVSNLYLADLMIIAIWAEDQKLIDDLKKVIDNGPMYLDICETELRKIADENWDDVVILADGEIQGIAAEGALAFTEIAQIAGRHFHCLDVRHGPMVLINEKSVVIVHITDNDLDSQIKLVNDIVNRGATVITYSSCRKEIDGARIMLDSGLSTDIASTAIPFINIVQLLSYFKAEAKGIDPDDPDGIDAWVKL